MIWLVSLPVTNVLLLIWLVSLPITNVLSVIWLVSLLVTSVLSVIWLGSLPVTAVLSVIWLVLAPPEAVLRVPDVQPQQAGLRLAHHGHADQARVQVRSYRYKGGQSPPTFFAANRAATGSTCFVSAPVKLHFIEKSLKENRFIRQFVRHDNCFHINIREYHTVIAISMKWLKSESFWYSNYSIVQYTVQ